MGVTFLPDRKPFLGGASDEVALWASAVVANGGTVSAGRATLVRTYVAALKSGGSWARTDDIWLLVAENAPQALTSLKQRRLATAVNTPVFTADAGYAFDGTTNYINTGFIPSTMAVAMTGSDMRIAAYERTNVIGSGTCAAGTADTGTRNLMLSPRTTGNFLRFACNCTITNGVSATIIDSRGLTAANRSAGPVFSGYRNGVFVETIAPANATALPSRVLYIGGNNNAGTAANLRAATEGLVSAGASLTAGQETADYNAVQAFMTSLGANV